MKEGIKQIVSATLDKVLLAKMDRLVKKSDRNRSWLINEAVEFYLDELEDLEKAKERLSDQRLTPSGLRRELGL